MFLGAVASQGGAVRNGSYGTYIESPSSASPAVGPLDPSGTGEAAITEQFVRNYFLHAVEKLLIDHLALRHLVHGNLFHMESFVLWLERNVHLESDREVRTCHER